MSELHQGESMVAVGPSNPKVDTDKIEKAIREILIAIGENPDREGLIDTPRRVAKFYQEFIQQNEPHCTIFSNVEHYDEMVVIKDINFYSFANIFNSFLGFTLLCSPGKILDC